VGWDDEPVGNDVDNSRTEGVWLWCSDGSGKPVREILPTGLRRCYSGPCALHGIGNNHHNNRIDHNHRRYHDDDGGGNHHHYTSDDHHDASGNDHNRTSIGWPKNDSREPTHRSSRRTVRKLTYSATL